MHYTSLAFNIKQVENEYFGYYFSTNSINGKQKECLNKNPKDMRFYGES